ncbi:MAG: hypothetical protein QXF24_07475 [Thermoproteota archaeon]
MPLKVRAMFLSKGEVRSREIEVPNPGAQGSSPKLARASAT